MKDINITAVTVHYGDEFWVRNLVTQLLSVKQIHRVVIASKTAIDLSIFRDKRVELRILNKQNQTHSSFDHAESILFLQNLHYQTDHILLLDTDIIGCDSMNLIRILEGFVNNLAILATDPKNRFYSHPCFMFLPTLEFKKIDFKPIKLEFHEKKGVKEQLIDTGRLAAFQLQKNGKEVYLTHPVKHNRVFNWDYYWELDIMHFGSRSFSTKFAFKKKHTMIKKIDINFSKWISQINTNKIPRSTFSLLFLILRFYISSLKKSIKNLI